MGIKFMKRKIRKLKMSIRRLKLKQKLISLGALAVLLLLLVGMIQARQSIPVTAYTPLLDLIASAESSGNYNAYFSNASNKEIIFTKMSVADVLKWQTSFVQAGNPSSAVGRYQFIQPTLEGLVKQLNIDTKVKFDEALQNKLAITLIERRGSTDYIDNKMSTNEFAHNLSKEWASLPRVIGNAPESSYYEGDGLNSSLVSSVESLNAVEQFKKRVEKS
jgi:hypothetical protein